VKGGEIYLYKGRKEGRKEEKNPLGLK